MPSYADLAAVYEWLTPEPLLTPEGNVAAFAPWIDPLPAGARVLDCAAGVGSLAVGLALRGLRGRGDRHQPGDDRAHARARRSSTGWRSRASVCAWEDLSGEPRFDAVFCVGNSIAHAEDRVGALDAMAGVLKPGGLLVITSRNWERERQPARGSRSTTASSSAAAAGRSSAARGSSRRTGTIPTRSTSASRSSTPTPVETVAERLTVWPFTPSELATDLRTAGLEVEQTTFTPEVERYLVTRAGQN